MNISPAVHIAFFGVYPTREIGDTMRESFLPDRAHAHEKDIAMSGRLLPDELERLMRGEGTPADMDAFQNYEESFDEQQAVARSSALRMRAAYQVAAREKWIKPIKGDVYLAPALPMADPDFADSLESAVVSTFFEAVRGINEPSLTLPAPLQDRMPLTVMTMTRCVIQGDVVPFAVFRNDPHMFKAAEPLHAEPDLDPAWFDLSGIDTVAHCRTRQDLYLSPLMGFSGFRPKPPGPRPV